MDVGYVALSYSAEVQMEPGWLWEEPTWIFSVQNSREHALGTNSRSLQFAWADGPCFS